MQERVLTRDFGLVTAAHFLQALGYASMVLLPVYLDHLDASRTEIGLIMASASLSGLLARPGVAWMLDHVGYRATVVAGTLTLSLGMVSFFFVRDVGWQALLARMAVGVGTGSLFTAYFALASRIVPASRRTQGLALFGISGLVPLVVNPLAQSWGIAPVDLRLFFPVIGVATLLSLVPIVPLRNPKSEGPVERPTWQATLRALRQPALRPVWLATIALAGFAASFMTYVTVVAAARDVPNPSSLWFAYAGGAALVRLGFGGVAERMGPSRLVAPAFIIFCAAGVAAATAESSTAFFAAGLLAGLGHGVGFPVITSLAVSRTPEHLRGAGMATLTGFWELSTLTLTPMFGLISDHVGDREMFFALASLALGTALTWGPLERRHPVTKASAALGE